MMKSQPIELEILFKRTLSALENANKSRFSKGKKTDAKIQQFIATQQGFRTWHEFIKSQKKMYEIVDEITNTKSINSHNNALLDCGSSTFDIIKNKDGTSLVLINGETFILEKLKKEKHWTDIYPSISTTTIIEPMTLTIFLKDNNKNYLSTINRNISNILCAAKRNLSDSKQIEDQIVKILENIPDITFNDFEAAVLTKRPSNLLSAIIDPSITGSNKMNAELAQDVIKNLIDLFEDDPKNHVNWLL